MKTSTHKSEEEKAVQADLSQHYNEVVCDNHQKEDN